MCEMRFRKRRKEGSEERSLLMSFNYEMQEVSHCALAGERECLEEKMKPWN